MDTVNEGGNIKIQLHPKSLFLSNRLINLVFKISEKICLKLKKIKLKN
ncbi:MAG: hypothetical protein IGBAC_0549 [Ignavibacteriae bacterium]|nr:MAG: hypothetical protein IGBAC_0549 [Ignavibacteriota bacterium]